jgi:putative tryptophan/tyrosine transport system substrate-binding protein
MQLDQLKRREFITLLCGTAVAWPLAARAQQPGRMRRVGLLVGLAEDDPETKSRVRAFRLGLRDADWVEGRNIRIDYRFSAGDPARAKQYAAELVSLSPDVIVGNSTPVLSALRQATTTIPIVFAVVNDPIGQGFVASLAHPGGNVTGFSFIEFPIVGKWIEMLKDVSPDLSRVALMFNPDTSPYYDVYLRSFERTPRSIAVDVSAAPVRDEAEIEQVIAKLGQEPGSGLIAAPDSFIIVRRDAILRSAKVHRVPVVSAYRQFVLDGYLMSYGPDTADIFWRAASYVDRILRGEKAADLPVQSPIKFELFVNMTAAKAFGLTIPKSFLQLADEVIE